MATTKAFELAQLSALTNVDTSGNVTTNTSQIANASGDLTFDSAADIILDADGAQLRFYDNGDEIGVISSHTIGAETQNLLIGSQVSNRNIIFQGLDDATQVHALVLDMSNDGRATFSENVVVAGTITGVTDFNSSGDMSVGGDLTVTGDLTVEGTTVSLNTTALDVEDKNITLNYHASNDTSASADGAGITIQDAVISGTDASILWNATDDKFIISHKMDVTGSISVASTNPVLTLQDTDATTTYNRTEFQNSGGGLNLNTRHSNGTFVSTDYQIGKNASGAVEHKWFIASTARHRITSAGDAEWYENNDGTQQVGMHWDYADGYLGIGDTAPEAPLFINGNESGINDLTPILWARSKTGASITQMNVQGDQIQFGGGATLDTSPTMTIDYGNNAVGIGETNPTTPLYIKGDSAYASGATDLADATTKAVVRIRGSNDSSTSIWMGGLANSMPYLQVANYNGSANDDLIFNPYGGNVGIGTDTAKRPLQIGATGSFPISFNGNYPDIHMNTYYEGGWRIHTAGFGAKTTFNGATGAFGFSNVGSTQTAGANFTPLERLTILANGNIGIGTDNPQASLEIYKETAGLISEGTGNQGATLRLHHEAQWESGYGGSPTNPDFLGSIDFSTGDASTGEGVKASIRTSVESYYNTAHLNFYTADGSGSTSMVERLSLQQNGRVVVNRGTSPNQPTHSDVVKNHFTVHTDYNAEGTQHVSLSNLNGNWVDGNTGVDSQYGMLFGYNNDTRGGLIYDHRGTEMMTMWSSYAPIRFMVPDASDGDGVPTDSNIKTALTIGLGGGVGIGTESPNTELHILDSADGGESWNTYQQVGRRAGTGNNLHFQTLHDGTDGVNAMAVRLGNARQVEIDGRDSEYTMAVTNDGGQAGDGQALRVVASGRGVGVLDVNVLQVENNNDVLFGVQNNGTLRGLNYLPTTRPAVLFDFANSKEVDNKITFERRSRATYHDADGMVRYAEVDEPRIEHNANTGECLGLLIEPARTNFLPNISSSEWTWSASATLETFTKETLSPAGDYTAAKLCRGTDSNYQTINYTTTSVPSGYVWITFYGKEKVGAPQDGGRFFVQWLDGTYSWQNHSFFLSGSSLNDGPDFSSVDGGNDPHTYFVRYVGNGWHHCGVRLQTGGQSIAFSFHPFRADTVAGTGNTGASNETCQYLWGVQLESGDYPTSYIPTWATPAARASELAFVDVNEHKIYKEEDATMFVDAFVYRHDNSSGHPIVRFDDRDVLSNVGTQASGSMSILNLDLYSGGLAARIGNNGANGTNDEIGDFSGYRSDFTKIALSYPNKTSVYYTHDGYQSLRTNDTSTIIPETKDISRMWFGNTQETTCIRKFAYWNKYYDLNTLNALTEG